MRRSSTFAIAAGIAVFALAAAQASPAPAQPSAPASATCDKDPGFHTLDFWLGTWRVTVDGRYDGTDVVTKILDGCAVTEDWRDAGGGKGKSLFYYDPFEKTWSQVWVTDEATVRGGLKMKRLIAIYPDKGTRFQGILPGPPGSKIVLDRTTLTPIDNNAVHQIIEISLDGGSTWRTTYDARYTRE
ncbi:MAG TPA: hypothetical protein VFO25_13910 [Candidatus Eremiobacteraceae bacterium]|nr:hypothetical protein [Candidatus Eremiobacteraceae bacterium]